MTEIIIDWPPNIAAIRKVLPVSERNIFAWDGIIYNPDGGMIGPELIAHEEIHFAQQAGRPKRWWKKFLKSPEFRLEQELEAHREEHRVFCELNRDRNMQARHLQLLSGRLAAPMYGGLIGKREAAMEIKK